MKCIFSVSAWLFLTSKKQDQKVHLIFGSLRISCFGALQFSNISRIWYLKKWISWRRFIHSQKVNPNYSHWFQKKTQNKMTEQWKELSGGTLFLWDSFRTCKSGISVSIAISESSKSMINWIANRRPAKQQIAQILSWFFFSPIIRA